MLIAILILIALVTGFSYEQLERSHDRERFPQIGRSVDIGGLTLNIFCSGAGAPAVIFESSAPRPGYSWVVVQREVARLTRACWYDRAGFGWSELGPYPRTSAAAARDLHALLRAAAISPPYILVAETLAAYDARVYTNSYPADVAGMVLVDGAHPDLFTRVPALRGKAAPIQKYIGYPQNVLSQLFNQFGILRLMFAPRSAPGPPPTGFTDAEWSTIWRLTGQPGARAALMQEFSAVDESADQARKAGSLGRRPLAVIEVENERMPPDYRAASHDLQADLVVLSTAGTQVLVQENAGPLQYQAPGVIVDAVRSVLAQLH